MPACVTPDAFHHHCITSRPLRQKRGGVAEVPEVVDTSKALRYTGRQDGKEESESTIVLLMTNNSEDPL